MRLSDLFGSAGVRPTLQRGDGEIGTLCADSRLLKAGQVFVCMPSGSTDSHGFIPAALERGASAVIVHSERVLEQPVPSALILREDFEDVLWKLARTSFGNPSKNLRVVGITGTNGKTTTAWILREALVALGRPCAYLGTLGYRGVGELERLPNTTPFAIDVQAFMRRAVYEGLVDFVMEVSSHALAQKRVDGVEFDAGVFTNLTQDHLDYHKTMAAYRDAKLRLFYDLPRSSFKAFRGAWNAESDMDPSWFPEDACTYSVGGTAEVVAHPVSVQLSGIELELHHAGQVAGCRNRLGGSFNVENTVAAASALVCLGYPITEIAEALGHANPVPGRLEPVANERGLNVLVDFAHTPDALARVLETARPLTKGKLIVVFGCGGDRDRAKRPLMAKAAGERADIVILTSDNPRTEDPASILADCRAGIPAGAKHLEIIDRREAVAEAIRLAEPGDTVILAGKGHEDYQIIGRQKFPMDDRLLAREALVES